jgi:hypothetical protein
MSHRWRAVMTMQTGRRSNPLGIAGLIFLEPDIFKALQHVAQKCAAVLRKRHAKKTKAYGANLKDRDAL